jgi:hypothetical protein
VNLTNTPGGKIFHHKTKEQRLICGRQTPISCFGIKFSLKLPVPCQITEIIEILWHIPIYLLNPSLGSTLIRNKTETFCSPILVVMVSCSILLLMMDDAAVVVVNSFYHTFFGISSGERAFGGRETAHVVPQFSHLTLGSKVDMAASRFARKAKNLLPHHKRRTYQKDVDSAGSSIIKNSKIRIK